MKWVIQRGFYSAANERALLQALERLGSCYTCVEIGCKDDELFYRVVGDSRPSESLEEATEPIIAMGSSRFISIAQDECWFPGYWGSGLDYQTWVREIPEFLLNKEVEVTLFGDTHLKKESFVRPLKDNKAFDGKVFSPLEWEEFKQRQKEKISKVANEPQLLLLRENTPVVVAAPREIRVESRLFVVGGEIVTSSLYRRAGTAIFESNVDDEVLAFGAQTIEAWQPNLAYVVDIAQTADGMGIVEFNALNSSGFYAADVQRLVSSLEAFVDR